MERWSVPREAHGVGGAGPVGVGARGAPTLPSALYHGVSRDMAEWLGNCWVFMVAGNGGFRPCFAGARLAEDGAASAVELPKQLSHCWVSVVAGRGHFAPDSGGRGARGAVSGLEGRNTEVWLLGEAG